MKTLLPLLLLGSLAVTARASDPADELPPAPQGKSFKLVWHDEFNGDKLDESKWTYRPDGKRKGGWWSRKAISLDGDGHLVITTFMDGDKPTDGCITTQGKFEHAFGYYVARAKFQKEPGHWSAFWITGPGVSKVGNGGRDGTEIDIMEKPWLDDRVTHNLHWDGYGEHHEHKGTTVTVPNIM
jgi:beta-glucanase (GH16 family)